MVLVMDNVINLDSTEKIVHIDSPQKRVGFLPLFFTLLILLLGLAALSFSIGYLVARVVTNEPEVSLERKAAIVTDKKDGTSLFSDSNDNFQLVFPSNWKATGKTKSPGGAIFETEGVSVELWLVVDQPLALSSEQTEGLEKTNKIVLTINKEKVNATEYSYKAGNFLTSAILPAKDNQPKVTFWLKSSNKENYEVAKTIVQSFTFTK